MATVGKVLLFGVLLSWIPNWVVVQALALSVFYYLDYEYSVMGVSPFLNYGVLLLILGSGLVVFWKGVDAKTTIRRRLLLVTMKGVCSLGCLLIVTLVYMRIALGNACAEIDPGGLTEICRSFV